MLIDYHIHTFLSDGIKNHKDYINAAFRKKIDEIGFAEHLNFKKFDWVMKFSDLPTCVKIVNNLKKKAKIPVKLGIEIDFIPGFEERIRKIIEKYPFDYVIGSVHLIDDWCFDLPENISEYKKRDIDKLYEIYFSLVQKAADSKLFDIIGHPDLIKKFGFWPKKDPANLLIKTAEVFKKSKVCIEVNTSGLDKPCQEIYPSKKFLKICFNQGIPIALGSDAHRPEDVGQYFDQALKLVEDVGYAKIIRFKERKRKLVEI